MTSRGDLRQRMDYLSVAREYVRKARQSLESDWIASNHETALMLTTEASLRDWWLALEREASGRTSEERGLSSVCDDMVRLGAKLDKIEALFETLVEQEMGRVAARNQFEQTVLAQLEPLRNAVTLLLQREPPSLVEKVQAAKAIQDAAPAPSTAEAKS